MNSKRTTIIFLSALLLIVLALAFVVTRPFLKPLAFAVILAVVFYPVHEQISRAIKGRPTLASLVSTFLLILLFGVPAFIITTVAANEALSAAHYLGRRSAEQGGLASFVMVFADKPLRWVGHWVDLSRYNVKEMVTAFAQRASVWMVGFGASVLGNLARFVVDALITFVVVFFFFRDGQDWAFRAGSLMPLRPGQVARLYRNISDTIIANVYGILSVGVAQGILTGIALRIVGMPSSLLWGLGAGFASIVPVVGASLIWAPIGIYYLFTGSIWRGVFLLVWGTAVISSADNIIRPWVVAGRVELHPMVLLFFILGGVEAFGFLGLFLGPVVASVLMVLFQILREEMNETEQAAALGG